MSNISKSIKKTDSHKALALKMQQQADSLLDNLFKMRQLGEEIDNKQLIATSNRAIDAAKITFSEILAIRTIITRDC